MATAGNHAPFMGSVTATTTAQQLLTLLRLVWSDLPAKAQFLQIQCNNDAGSATLFVGNSNVTSTMAGVNLTANQAVIFRADGSNLTSLADIYLLASTGTIQVNIISLTR